MLDKKYFDGVGIIVKEQRIHCRELVVHNKEGIKYHKKYTSPRHQIKLLDKESVFFSDNIILDDRIIYISYGEKIIALEIINPILVNTQITIFNLAWNSVKRNK